MAKTFTSLIGLENFVESACKTAVEKVAQRCKEELRSYVREDFYNQYAPKYYDRTYSFLFSATYKMLSGQSASVFIDTGVMNYLGQPSGITGDYVAKMASLGFHGSPEIFREGYFWEDFMKWAEMNIPHLMKAELKKQGLTVK